jgi:hypothetical protein
MAAEEVAVLLGLHRVLGVCTAVAPVTIPLLLALFALFGAMVEHFLQQIQVMYESTISRRLRH